MIRFDDLIHDLHEFGALEVEAIRTGPYPSTAYQYTGADPPDPDLTNAALVAVREAVEFIGPLTGAQLSDITHEHSRTWRDAQDGDELSIYLDLLNDEEYATAVRRAKTTSDELKSAWQD